jgi:hypothetical protein
VIRSRHIVAGVILWGTAFGVSTPTVDHGAPSGAASLQAGTGQPASAIAALTGVHLMLPETTTVPSITTVSKTATPDPDRAETVGPATEAPVSETPLVPSAPTPPEARLRLASVSTSDPMEEHRKPTMRRDGTPDECAATQTCIDDYLWSLYERAPKVDVNKVTEQKRDGQDGWQDAHHHQDHYELRLGGLHVEGSESGRTS